MPEPQHEHLDTLTWLQHLYGTAEEGWLTLFSLDRTSAARGVDWAPVDDLEALADAAARREPNGCVWFGAATRWQRLGDGKRGGNTDCDAIPGLWLDIDVAGPGHLADHRLAANRAHAHQLVNSFPLPATAVIDSGGGLQAWWLFNELTALDDRTRDMLAAWGATWARLGDEQGIDLDNVFEPARVMRLPGTTNRKEGLVRPVELVDADWTRRYGLDDIDAHLDPVPVAPAHRTGDRSVPYIGPERPGDAFNARHTGGDVLARAGFTLARKDRNGEEHWCRPGKEARDGTSATVYPDDGHVTIWSDTCAQQWPSLELRRPYDAFGLYAAIEHAGDWRSAGSHLRSQGYGGPLERPGIVLASGNGSGGGPEDGQADTPAEDEPEPERADWAPLDLDEVLGGNAEPPTPTILAPTNGTALLYEGRVNSIFGESGVGKTWIELAAIVDVIGRGGIAMLIDLEDTPHGIISRLRLLGLTDHQIRTQFLYVSPQTGWSPAAQATIATLLAETDIELVCIDSTGEAMAASGVKGNDDDDVARWFVNFPKFIARRGPAVLIIDHIPKDPNAPSGYAIGSQRKIAAVDGAAYRVESIKVPSRVDDGVLKVIVAKDRHGNHTKGKAAATVAVTHTDRGVKVTLTTEAAPVDDKGKFRPTIIMERVSLLLEQRPGLSRRQIESQTSGKAASIRTAIDLLFQEGNIDFAVGSSKGGAAFEVVKPFREASEIVLADHSDPVDNVGESTGDAQDAAYRVPRVPPASPRVPAGGDAPGSEARPLPPPPTGQGRAEPLESDIENQSSASPSEPEVDDDPFDLGLEPVADDSLTPADHPTSNQ